MLLIQNTYSCFQKGISESLARKWCKPYSKVKEWACVQSQLVIHMVSLRVRGMRKKIRSLPFEDGAALIAKCLNIF